MRDAERLLAMPVGTAGLALALAKIAGTSDAVETDTSGAEARRARPLTGEVTPTRAPMMTRGPVVRIC